jgi:hypothetical protein
MGDQFSLTYRTTGKITTFKWLTIVAQTNLTAKSVSPSFSPWWRRTRP